MTFRFVADDPTIQAIEVPDFEDARADFAPYYDVRPPDITVAQNRVSMELGKLGALVQLFVDGKFIDEQGRERHGYIIRFVYHGAPGVLRCAGLPFKHGATALKVKRAKVQALYNAADWLKAAVTSRIFTPGTDVLIGNLLVAPDKDITIAESIHQAGNLPASRLLPGE